MDRRGWGQTYEPSSVLQILSGATAYFLGVLVHIEIGLGVKVLDLVNSRF